MQKIVNNMGRLKKVTHKTIPYGCQKFIMTRETEFVNLI